MSFNEFLQDDPLLTREQVMTVLIQVADELDMPDKRGACIIAGITVAQEAGVNDNDPPYSRRFWCPANHADPESFDYPHDSVSDDGLSVGYFQQQKSVTGDLWWGPTSSEMDLHSAATQFMTRLMRLGYSAANSQLANDAAQGVQGSGVPWAYAQWFDDIVSLYNSVKPNTPVSNPGTNPTVSTPAWLVETNIIDGNNSQSRNGQAPRLFVLHTEEGGMLGQALDAWMDNNGVSYHYAADGDGRVWDLVDTDLASWSVLDANGSTINLVFAGSYSGWTRIEWLQKMGEGIKSAAYICAQDCKKYGIPPVVRVGNSASGYPSLRNNNGVTDHRGITVGLGIGTHTDVGPNFPWDVFNQYLQTFYGATEEDDMFSDDDRATLASIKNALTNPIYSRSIYREPGEGPIGNVGDLLANDDAMEHMELVERSAVLGDRDSIRRVQRTAAGMGAVNDTDTVRRAIAVLHQVPADILKEFTE